MNNSNSDTKNFERNKNAKAFSYTILICALLFLFFILTGLSLPAVPKPIVDEGIEVNLGNSETGMGDLQPQAIGENIAKQTTSIPNETSPQESIDKNGEEVINTPPKTIEAKPIITKPTVIITKPVVTIKPPTPKAVFGPQKSNNNGGNKSDKNNGIDNFGNKDGKGIIGKPDGMKDGSLNGSNGLSIKSGLSGRKVAIRPTFTDEFNENAKVCVDVTVDASGKVLTATINPRGTTTTNAAIRNIAKKKAFEIKFSNGKDEDFGTIVFDFKVTN